MENVKRHASRLGFGIMIIALFAFCLYIAVFFPKLFMLVVFLVIAYGVGVIFTG